MSVLKWLKKYTELRFLRDLLTSKQLHLGHPRDWADKNDSKCLELCKPHFRGYDLRATCLTGAPDRFHFWYIFGKKQEGVCLWFEKDTLCGDIARDNTLKARMVNYLSARRIRDVAPCCLPFTKREQYKDECEFRVVRHRKALHPPDDKFTFCAASLKRIYLNPWLSYEQAKKKKLEISAMLGSGFEHVKVYQNRSLEQEQWIDAVRHASRQ